MHADSLSVFIRVRGNLWYSMDTPYYYIYIVFMPLGPIIQTSFFFWQEQWPREGGSGVDPVDHERGERVQTVSGGLTQHKASVSHYNTGHFSSRFKCIFCFFREVSSNCSFGEMLFLIAIHFHSNNMTAIGDLVYLTLGLKVSILYDHCNVTSSCSYNVIVKIPGLLTKLWFKIS